MSEKKMSEGRRKWKMNAIALLKPLVLEGNHISRRIAVKLVKPTNDWERRQLDTLRGQANKIIRRENTEPLLYAAWGMSLEHPAMATVKKISAAMKEINPHGSPFVMPERLNIRGLQESPEAVYHDGLGNPRQVEPGEVWALRSGNLHQLMFIEEGDTYVLSSPIKPGHMVDATPGERFDRHSHIGLARIDFVGIKPATQTAETVLSDTVINLMRKEDALACKSLKRGDAYSEEGRLHVYTGESNEWLKLDMVANRNNPHVQAIMPKPDSFNACGVPPLVRGKANTVEELPDVAEQGDLYYVEELNFEPIVHNGTDWVSSYPPFEVVKKCLPPAKGQRRMQGGQVEFWDGTQWVMSMDDTEERKVAVFDPERQKKLSVWQRLKRMAGFK